MPLYCNTSAHELTGHEHELGAERRATRRSLLYKLYGSHAKRYTSTSNCSPQPQIKPIKSDGNLTYNTNGMILGAPLIKHRSAILRNEKYRFFYDVCECLWCDEREACVNLLNYGSNCTWICHTRLLATDWYQPEQMSYLVADEFMTLKLFFFILVLFLLSCWIDKLKKFPLTGAQCVCVLFTLFGNWAMSSPLSSCVRLDYLCLQSWIVDLNDSSSTANVT